LDGPGAALPLVDELDLGEYHLFHATRAELLRRLGRLDEATAAYDAALARTANEAEREFLRSRRPSLFSGPNSPVRATGPLGEHRGTRTDPPETASGPSGTGGHLGGRAAGRSPPSRWRSGNQPGPRPPPAPRPAPERGDSAPRPRLAGRSAPARRASRRT